MFKRHKQPAPLFFDIKPVTYESSALARKLAEDAGYHCWYCDKPMNFRGPNRATVEHMIPLSAGGSWHHSNLVPAHTYCNSRAGSLLLCQKWKLRQEMRKHVS